MCLLKNRKNKDSNKGHEYIICLLLVLTILVVFWQGVKNDFTNFDDNQYVTENQHVQAGLTWKNLVWAFTTTKAVNWHPLTWLSHMLDCQLYGLNPAGHHLTNVLLHSASTILLFLVLQWMTGARWRSAFVAALFAVHPLHVESVAWVAERKDVLSAFFWMLTLWAYAWYVYRPTLSRYLLTLLCFVLGILAKPMAVTLPFVLLLLDYWPLNRLALNQQVDDKDSLVDKESLSPDSGRWFATNVVIEKLPFLSIAALTSIVTLFIQQSSGAAKSLVQYPLTDRITTALVSYVSYIVKMIWPQNLAVFYPHPGQSLTMWQPALAGLLLVVVSVVLIRAGRRYPYLPVGWLWYVGTLVPVIGLIQSGDQGMADRYTYIPLIGLFIIISWGVSEFVKNWRHRRIVLALTASTLLLILTICALLQVRHWKNDITLFTHALNVTENNFVAHNNLGAALARQGKLKDAIPHFIEALRIFPDYERSHFNLGLARDKQGALDEALVHFSEALQIKPDYPEAHNGLGVALARQGRLEEAIAHFRAALQLQPDNGMARANLDLAIQLVGETTKK
jgi:tetratricopeptide (TPR) repeat protein